eukprot:1587645-Pyramimonas_sp.AAC.1
MGGYQARCRAGIVFVTPCEIYEALYIAGLPAPASSAALLARCRALGSSAVMKYMVPMLLSRRRTSRAASCS